MEPVVTYAAAYLSALLMGLVLVKSALAAKKATAQNSDPNESENERCAAMNWRLHWLAKVGIIVAANRYRMVMDDESAVVGERGGKLKMYGQEDLRILQTKNK